VEVRSAGSRGQGSQEPAGVKAAGVRVPEGAASSALSISRGPARARCPPPRGDASCCLLALPQVVFTITDPAQKLHIPLLISPYSYTTYRGS